MSASPLLRHRWLLYELTRRELANRYAGSVSGFAWTFVQPIAQLAIFAFVFSQVFRAGVPENYSGITYTAFVAVALWPWIMFSEGVQRGMAAVAGNAGLIRKVALPTQLLVYATVIACYAINLAGFVVVLLVLYAANPQQNFPLPWPSTATLQQHVEEANRAYATGGLVAIWRFSFAELPLIGPLHQWVFPRTLALFLAGMLAWRTGFLQNIDRYKAELAVAAWLGLSVGAAFTTGIEPAARLANVFFAMGYGAAVLLLVQLPVTGRALRVFAPLGRMAFTNYIMQSLVFGFIFFGYGLGQFGRLGAAQALAIGVTLFVGQMVFSACWLRRYRYGPLEWLWRTLMYGRLQPINLQK